MRLNLARTLSRSAANGPGERFVLWVQGCPLACPGCWNPDTWAFERRDLRTVEDVAASILATDGIEGVTFTGGEPFAQARALASLADHVRRAGLSVFVFTGYELDELTGEWHRALLDRTDMLVTGRYQEAEREDGLVWRGSANQRVWFLTDRYGPGAMDAAPAVEVHVGHDGGMVVTGFPVAAFAPEGTGGIGGWVSQSDVRSIGAWTRLARGGGPRRSRRRSGPDEVPPLVDAGRRSPRSRLGVARHARRRQ